MVKYERRYLDRIKIPGAKIEYDLTNGNTVKTDLIDLTKISVRFYTKNKLNPGDSLQLSILVKDYPKISVKGHIVWSDTSSENIKKRSTAVVQFLPFGTYGQYNSLESYEILAKLENDFSKENKIKDHIYVT
jgi:hypothetical protein